MSQKTDTSDEMIARYLSGKATPEEEAAILDYIAESDENFDDFLAMSAAVEQSRKQKTEHKSRIRPLWPALSAAASVALLIGVGIAIWHNSWNNVSIDQAPAYATQDSIVETNMEDTL
ncbi:MAG: hypothetical protein K6E96_09030 [Bacteroidales bacterium]|nr:hypothetical protein [Bacteroidales bacterium]